MTGPDEQLPGDVAADMASDGAVTGEDTPAATDDGSDDHLDVRTILAEIGAEETLARHEGRLASVEDDLERALKRVEESERRQQGELTVMRARVDDALAALHGAADEHREATSQIEERLAAVAASGEATSRELASDLRDELMPRIQRALLSVDEASAQLRGEVEAVREDTTARADTLAHQVGELRATAEGGVAELRAEVDGEARARADAVTAVEDRLGARLDDQAGRLDAQAEAAVERVEALRRELDAATGELRAGLHLRAQALEDAVADARSALEDQLEGRQDAAADLERRWVQGTREIVRRIEMVASEARATVDAERAAREEAETALRGRLDEHSEVVDELRVRLSATLGRRETDMEQVRRSVDEIHGHVEILQGRLASAVGQVVGALTTEVSELAGDVEAVRDAAMEQGRRLAGVEHLGQRVSELAARQEELSQRADHSGTGEQMGRMGSAVAELRERLRSIDAAVQAEGERHRALQSSFADLRDSVRAEQGLRQEVRDLAARCAELARRVEETEELARTAGRAVVRLGRGLERGGGPGAERATAVRDVDRPVVVDVDEQDVRLFDPRRRPGQ